MVNNLFIDGLDCWTTYGVGLTSYDGALDLPKRKRSISKNWPDEHGEDVDASWNYYETREIKLDLFIQAASEALFHTQLNSFFTAIRGTNLRQVRFNHIPKVFMSYCDGGIAIQRKTKFSASKIVATFQLSFIEPQPITRQYTNAGSNTASFIITCAKTITIYWGDGTIETVTGTAVSKSHAYAAGARYCVLAGDIEAITAITSVVNLTLI
jgi:hypothetical protein